MYYMVNPPKRRGGWCAVVSDDPETRIRGFSCTRLNSPGGTMWQIKVSTPEAPSLQELFFMQKANLNAGGKENNKQLMNDNYTTE